MALHFKCSPVELDKEQVLDYLQYTKNRSQTPSSSYFKHTVYGLRYAYRIMGMEESHVFLPKMKFPKKLPAILSKQEMKQLINAPYLLKHKLVIALLYDCGLRRSELLNLELTDIHFDRKVIHIREGKGRKDRYVPISDLMIRGIQKYIRTTAPYIWLLNGTNADGKKQQFSETGVQWILRQACKKAGIKKQVTSHILRHTYATHLLEMGIDILTLKDMLGHVDIHTTMMYLHVAQLDKSRAFAPLDKIYNFKK